MNSIIKKIGLALFGAMVIVSCSKNEGIQTEVGSELSVDDVKAVVLADDVSENLDNILEDSFGIFGLGRPEDASRSTTPDCYTYTKEEGENSVTVILDFNEEGCTDHFGNNLSGKITMVYSTLENGYSYTTTFEEFTYGDYTVNGTKSTEYIKENENGNKQFTCAADFTMTNADAETVAFKGTRTREKIEGGDTIERGDDVYSISGNWEYTNENGETYSATIIENLRREFACRYIVSGVTEVSKNGVTYTVDFGDGECDNIAIVTDADGNETEISLRKHW